MATLLQSNYTSIDGNQFAVNVFLESFVGDFYTPNGSAVLSYSEIKDIMTVARGCEMDVQLEIKKEDIELLNILSLVTGDREARGRLFKNGQTIFEGYLRPDSISYPLNTEYIIVNLSFTDGLGILKGTEYRNTDGSEYRGVERELVQLARVLQLTGSSLNFRIYDIGLIFDAGAPLSDFDTAIDKTYTNQDRYRNNDQENSVFDCLKVLEGILKKYGCCIFQHKNRWHIYKISRFMWQGFQGLLAEFDEYNSNGVLLSSSSMGAEGEFKEFFIGSQLGGYDPFFCNANQSIQLNGTIGAYKAYYEYGVLVSTLINSDVIFNNTAGSIDGWGVFSNNDLTYITDEQPLRALLNPTYPNINNVGDGTATGRVNKRLIDNNANFTIEILPLNLNVYYILNTSNGQLSRVLEVVNDTELRLLNDIMFLGNDYIIQLSEIETVTEPRLITTSQNDAIYDEGESLKLNFQGYTLTQQLQTTDYIVGVLITDINDSTNQLILSNNLNWQIQNEQVFLFEKKIVSQTTTKTNFSIDFKTASLPFACTVSVTLYAPRNYLPLVVTPLNSGILFTKVIIAPDVEAPQIKGESYTSRFAELPAMTKSELKTDFYTGDSDADVYIGAIQNIQGDSIVQWRRRLSTQVSPLAEARKLLGWIAYERLSVQNENQKVLTGSIRGFVPYLGSFVMPEIEPLIINDVQFMLTKYTYNTKIEQIDIKLVKITDTYFANPNIIVDFNLESDEIVEPKIIG